MDEIAKISGLLIVRIVWKVEMGRSFEVVFKRGA
jgi:hypothetical protein